MGGITNALAIDSSEDEIVPLNRLVEASVLITLEGVGTP
jgi:hypothetical protein